MRFTANSPADIASLSARNTCLNNDAHADDHLEINSVKNQTKSVCDENKTKSDNATAVINSKDTNISVKKSRQVGSEKRSGSSDGASPRGGQTSPRENQIPMNSVQFQADYRRLKSDKQAFYQYFKVIKKEIFMTMFLEEFFFMN